MAITLRLNIVVDENNVTTQDLDEVNKPVKYFYVSSSPTSNNSDLTLFSIHTQHHIYDNWCPVLTLGNEYDRGTHSIKGVLQSEVTKSKDSETLGSSSNSETLGASQSGSNLDIDNEGAIGK